MRILLASALILNISFASVIDDYLATLKQEALKSDSSFKSFNPFNA